VATCDSKHPLIRTAACDLPEGHAEDFHEATSNDRAAAVRPTGNRVRWPVSRPAPGPQQVPAGAPGEDPRLKPADLTRDG
jgi:hypothetical protein